MQTEAEKAAEEERKQKQAEEREREQQREAEEEAIRQAKRENSIVNKSLKGLKSFFKKMVDDEEDDK